MKPAEVIVDYLHIALLGWKTLFWVGVEAELKSESIFSGWSRSWSRSRLKFVDSGALLLTFKDQPATALGWGWGRDTPTSVFLK